MRRIHILRCPQIGLFGLRLREAMNVILRLGIAMVLVWHSWEGSIEASGEHYVMPRELVQYAESHGCLQVSNFFDKSGAIEPPYAYGYFEGEEEDSAVFWCKKKIADEKPYLLMVFVRDTPAAWSTCLQPIEWWNQPGGLSIHHEKSLTLGSFMKVANPHQHGPPKQRVEHSTIMSSYDGVSVVFYCHKGEWFFRMSH